MAGDRGAIVCSKSLDVTNMTRKVLREEGVKNVETVANESECLKALTEFTDSILMLDWGLGIETCGNILEQVQTDHPAGTRPVFLFSRSEDDEEILTNIGLEYNIMQVHTGAVSRDVIHERINNLFNLQTYNQEILDGLNAVVKARHGNDDSAEYKLLMNLYNRYPDDEFIATEVADMYWRREQYDDALATLEPFLTPDQSHPRILNIHGRVLMKKGLFEEASVSLQQADLINPYNVKRLIGLGDAYLQLDNPSRAKVNFLRALDISPQNPSAKKGVGTSLLLLGDINEALVFLRQISDAAELASVFNVAAVIAIRSGRHDDGVDLYKTACKTLPHEKKLILAKLAFNMGLAYYRREEMPRALYYFEIAARIMATYRKAKDAYDVLIRRVEEKDRIPVGSDLLAALVGEGQGRAPADDPDFEGEDMELRGESAEYDMDF